MRAALIGKSARTIDVRGLLPPGEWDAAPEFLRVRIVDFACGVVRREKVAQLANGIGADGRRLARVNPKSRPDGAKGPPLSPHRGDSRAQKWCRVIPGYKAGTAVVTWSHGWLAVLTYHAEGRVIGTYIRNVLEFHESAKRRIAVAIREEWRSLMQTHSSFLRWPGGGGAGGGFPMAAMGA